MNKGSYINELKKLLQEYDLSQEEINEIIEDYSLLWDEYTEKGMTQLEIYDKLGKPQAIIEELTEGVAKKIEISLSKIQSRKNKFIAISPFIALISFFLLGLIGDLWVYAWMVFLIIPISAIILNSDLKKPIPLLTALSPFVALILYFVIMGPLDLWHPGWLIFLIIPAIGVLNDDNPLFIICFEALLIGGVAGYLYLEGLPEYASYAWLAFIPVIACGLSNGEITVVWNLRRDYLIILLSAAIIYVLGGYFLDLWDYLWIVFLSIPVYAIWTEAGKHARIIAVMPFVAVTLFMTLGYFFDGWVYAWLAFLLIPMVAILKEA
jgi:uncharacterized membrane protein